MGLHRVRMSSDVIGCHRMSQPKSLGMSSPHLHVSLEGSTPRGGARVPRTGCRVPRLRGVPGARVPGAGCSIIRRILCPFPGLVPRCRSKLDYPPLKPPAHHTAALRRTFGGFSFSVQGSRHTIWQLEPGQKYYWRTKIVSPNPCALLVCICSSINSIL